MKNKKWLLLLIIALPSVFWLILESSTIHSKKLPFYGPKKIKGKGDTAYYKVNSSFYSGATLTSLNESDYPLYVVMFISEKYQKDGYRVAGLWEYLNYKKEKIEHIPFVLVTENENGKSPVFEDLKKLLGNNNVHFFTWNKAGFDSLVQTYFNQKPYYVDYSSFMLIDANRHIRGYYDGRQVTALKRLIDEYKHLRLKEEKERMSRKNQIEVASDKKK